MLMAFAAGELVASPRQSFTREIIMTTPGLRIAMWSGPRNISTALMRSWGNREDTVVCDEPLYAHYLQVTGLDHPGRDEVIACHEPDWRKVVAQLVGPIPDGRGIFFQKHMAHHLLPEIGRDWLSQVTNCFLIRDPQEMLTSLIKILPQPTVEDTGLPQQLEIFELVRRETGQIPPVLDARDVLDNPRQRLTQLCDRLRVPFSERMMSWPPGRRTTDGVWARHWYAQVESSTSFRPYESKGEPVPESLQDVLLHCQDCYDRLSEFRLR